MQLLQEFHEGDTKTALIARPPALFIIGLLLLCLGLTACGGSSETQRLNSRDLAQANQILEEIARTELLLSPESASRLGLEDLGPADVSARLDDHSQAGFERKRLLRFDLIALAQSGPNLPEEHPLARDLRIIEDGLQRLIALQIIGHGRLSMSEARPYAIDPYSGVWIDLPGLMVNDQVIRSQADAEAYLERLWAMPDAIDDARRRLIADSEAGLTPPAALLNETLEKVEAFAAPQIGGLDAVAATYSSIVQSLPDLDPQIAERLSEDGILTVNQAIRPAYARLAETLAELAGPAPVHGGFWAQPNGHNSFVRILEWYTGQDILLDQLHDSHLAATQSFAAQLEQVLSEREIEPGPLSARLQAFDLQLLAAAEAETPPDNTSIPEGDEAIALPAPPAPFVPPSILRPLTAPPLTGFDSLPARLDDQRPSAVVTYPEQIARWPNYMHAAMRLQQDIALREPFAAMIDPRQSATRALVAYPAFESAWKMLAVEQFGSDYLTLPEDEIGLTRLLLLNAAMGAVDTGLHHKRWTISEATEFLTMTTGLPDPLMREAVLRIAANPGQATARLIGYTRLSTLQARARAVMNTRYEESAFQTILLSDGPRPFAMIEADVDQWFEGELSGLAQGN